jgi:murein L,D-transpeptidase YcbB/YkuD
MKKTLIVSACLVISLLSGCSRGPSAHSVSLPSASAPNTTNKIALALYEKLPVYAKASQLTWEPIEIKKPIKPNHHASPIPVVRERLIALRDYHAPATKSTLYDFALAHAVMQFQYEHGLKENGVLDRETIETLNVKPAVRYHEMVESMNQWAKYPEESSSRYILVNIPEYTMMLIDHGQPELKMKVIVGRPTRPTPTLSSSVTTIVFNPHWNVPKTILAKDVIPGMRENPNYLKEHYDMHIYASYDKNAKEINPASIDWQTATLSNFAFRVTAPPSDKNPLGRVKFLFKNEHDVYMHDTPEKEVFTLKNRARSSGCIRLEDPMKLVQYFYRDNNDLNEALTQQYLSNFDTKYVQLRNPLPVYVVYITAWADRYGNIHFGKDIYAQTVKNTEINV